MTAAPLRERVRLRQASTGAGPMVGVVVEWPGERPLLADVVPVFERLGVRVANARSLPDDDESATPLDLLLPDGVAPVTSSSAGTVAGSTAREW